MNLREESKDFEAAGSLADELPWWGWLPDGECLLGRNGNLIALGQLTPAPVDGRAPAHLDRVLNRWQRALSNLDDKMRLYFYFLRRPAELPKPVTDAGEVVRLSQQRRGEFLAGRVSDVSVYVAWCYDSGLQAAGSEVNGGVTTWLRRWMAQRQKPNEVVYLRRSVEAAAEQFRQSVAASRALVSDLTPIDLLGPQEGSRVLSELVNRPGTPWSGATGSGLNWQLAVSELEAERRFLRLDGEAALVYSMLSPPGEAKANLLADLFRLDATLTVSLEWKRWGLDSARRKIRSAQRHYFSKRYSMAAHMQETEGTAAAMTDTAAEAESSRLGSALVELEADGVSYGSITCTVTLHGDYEQIDHLDAEVRRIFNTYDAKVIREGYGQLPAWFCRLPGQPPSRNVRSVFASAGLCSCLAPIFGSSGGRPISKHLHRPALAVLETRSRTPYHYDLFAGDVGHTLILGATGAGKSFTLNFLLVSALQYNPRVLILDLGGSYRWLTSFLGGSYLELSPSEEGTTTFKLRPFSLPATERTYQFLASWVARLLRIGGGEMAGADTTEIHDRIVDLYKLPPAHRTLGGLVRTLPQKMWPPLSRWHGGGAWATIFDNPATGDDLKLADWQVIDLAGAAEHEDLCEAALFYLLERLRLALENPAETARVKLMVVDEAWRYLRDPAVLSYLAEAAKTWRKKNAALILATQSAVDLTGTAGAPALLESLPTKLFLANPDLPSSVADVFHLNDQEVELIRGLLPKREMYLRRSDEFAVLRLEVDKESYWLYTSSAVDAEKRAQAVEEHGLVRGIELLAKGEQ